MGNFLDKSQAKEEQVLAPMPHWSHVYNLFITLSTQNMQTRR